MEEEVDEQLRLASAETLADYEAVAEAFAAGNAGHDVSQNIGALLRALEGRSAPLDILDLGCAGGRDLVAFSELGHRAVGLDGAPAFCEMARRASGCEVWQQDLQALSLPLAAFDGIFANACLFHVPSASLPRALGALAGALREGGALFVSNAHGFGEDREGWTSGRTPTTRSYVSWLSEETWCRYCRAAGLELLESFYRPPNRPRAQQPFLATVWRKPAAASTAATAPAEGAAEGGAAAVHGTLDNCASFAPLAPLLAAAGHAVFAMDLTGHGRSAWRSGGFYHRTGWVLEVLQTVDALGADWVDGEQPLVLMGHSLGASLCSMAVGAFPERFSAAVLIDGLGWWGPRSESEMAELAKAGGYAGSAYQDAGPDYYRPVNRMRRTISSILTLDEKRAQGAKVYGSLEAAVEARMRATEASPVGQFISPAAARAIVGRGTRAQPGGGVSFAHDSRISAATRSSAMLDEDALTYLARIPRLLLLHGDPRHTWPGIHERTAARLPHLEAERVEVHRFPGEGHHLHADSPGHVLPAILAFLAGLRPPGSAAAAAAAASRL